MKRTDFIYTGGYPLTQNRLGELQDAYMEAFSALLSVLREEDLRKGVILSGMAYSRDSDTVTITDGWLAAKTPSGNAQLYRCDGGTFLSSPSTENAYISIADHTTDVAYNNDMMHPAKVDRYGTPVTGAMDGSSAVDGILLFYPAMLRYGTSLGLNHRDAEWGVLTMDGDNEVSLGGELKYKRDLISNTVHLKGLLIVGDAQSIAPSPDGTLMAIGNLPYAPPDITTGLPFWADVHWGGGAMMTDDGSDHLRMITGFIYWSGDINLLLIRPQAEVDGYYITINTIISLD